MPDPQPERQNLRQLIRQRRKSLSQAEQQAAAQQLVERFPGTPGILAARRIALYLANDGGRSPCRHPTGCGPGKGGLPAGAAPPPQVTCSSCATPPPPPMTRNRYGIAEPELDVQQVLPHSMLDIICTRWWPSMRLATASAWGSCYDRTLACWHEHQLGPRPLGLAHDCQQVDAVPGAVGRAAPQIITPSRSWHFA